MFDFTKAVGKGSRAQVEGFIMRMMSSTSCLEISEKQQRGWKVPGWGLAVGADGAGELERRERMVLTFVLKKVRKLLHCFSVVLVWWRVCGLRR